MVERCPDKTEVDGPIPSMLTRIIIYMNLELNTFREQVGPSFESKEKLNFRILYAEDSMLIAGLFLELFRERYAVVDFAPNGQDLMDKLNSGEIYDCILTDNAMPRKIGLQALKEIRSIEKFKDIPVVVLTGDELAIGDEVRSLNAVCIGKPPTDNEVFNSIENLVNKKL